MTLNLHGRRLVLAENSSAGVAQPGHTVFEFQQEGEVFWGSYSGGHIARGVLVGVHAREESRFWFQQVNVDGQFRAGTATTQLSLDDRGALLMRDEWQYTAGAEGRGAALLRELVPAE